MELVYKKSPNGVSASPTIMLLFTSMSVTLLLMCLVLQNLIININIGYVCATIFVYPFICILLDIIAEIYGYRMSRHVLWFTILSTIIFSTVITFITMLPSPSFNYIYSQKFNIVTSHLLRNSLVGAVSILIGQTVNIYIITKFRHIFNGKYFAIRSICATFIGDTITFALSLFGFFVHKMSAHQIFVITADELLIMYCAAFILSIPGSIIVSFFKKNADELYSESVKINPFTNNSGFDH